MENYPEKLDITIGGFFDTYYHVKMKNDQLLYGSTRLGEPQMRPIPLPDKSRWDAFWKFLEENEVWNWKKSYQCEETVLDGTQWRVKIVYGDKKLKCCGENAFPKHFKRFEKAVRKLLGGRDFRHK